MDSSMLRKLFNATIESANILGLDTEFVSTLSSMKSKLPELKIGSQGTIMEWPEDYEEVEIGHRHISQLFALHPAGEISVDGTPQLAEAARKTLERRLSHGGGHTGWSCAWIINMWARLGDAENAHKYIHGLLSKSTYPNMFDAHPPFQIDGNFGATAGITEMLLQSNGGVLKLLPALPKQWSEGYVKGLKGRGNYEVAIEWTEGQLEKAIITTCNPSSTVKIKVNNMEAYTVKCKDAVVPFIQGDKGIFTFEVEKGEQYIIEKK